MTRLAWTSRQWSSRYGSMPGNGLGIVRPPRRGRATADCTAGGRRSQPEVPLTITVGAAIVGGGQQQEGEVPMTLSTVPDYFQEETEEALQEQVGWLIRAAGLDDSFFARLLRLDEGVFAGWRSAHAPLPAEGEQTLRNFWRMTLHLLSFLNCDEAQL